MSFDLMMIVVAVGGILLSAAYVRAEYRSWREQGVLQKRREAALRDLHAARLSEQHEATLLPSVAQLHGFGDSEAANHYSIAERRKRTRKSATPA